MSRVYPVALSRELADFQKALADVGKEFTPAETVELCRKIGAALLYCGPGLCRGCGKIVPALLVPLDGLAAWCPDCWLPRRMLRETVSRDLPPG